MKFDSDRFTAAQVVSITGVPYGTLNYWARIGLVKPSVTVARGSGSRRVYDFQDLAAIQVAQKLSRAGIFGRALAPILAAIRQAGFDSAASVAIHVTADGEVIVTPCSGEAFSARRHPGQLYLAYDFREAADEIRAVMKSRDTAGEKALSTRRSAPHSRDRKRA